MFDVMPNNFCCTDWRPDCCILYPLRIQEKSRKDNAQCWTEIFTDSKTELGAFLPPSAILGLKQFSRRLYTPGGHNPGCYFSLSRRYWCSCPTSTDCKWPCDTTRPPWKTTTASWPTSVRRRRRRCCFFFFWHVFMFCSSIVTALITTLTRSINVLRLQRYSTYGKYSAQCRVTGVSEKLEIHVTKLNYFYEASVERWYFK